MRNRVARIVVVGLILAFPPMLHRASPGASVPMALGVEMAVVVGLLFAGRERGRLLAMRPAVVEAMARPATFLPGPTSRPKRLRVHGTRR